MAQSEYRMSLASSAGIEHLLNFTREQSPRVLDVITEIAVTGCLDIVYSGHCSVCVDQTAKACALVVPLQFQESSP
jgi:hypothetical protein